MGWKLGEKVTKDDIIKAVIELYPELHEVRNDLDNEHHPSAGCLKHTLCNLQAILSYYAEAIDEE